MTAPAPLQPGDDVLIVAKVATDRDQLDSRAITVQVTDSRGSRLLIADRDVLRTTADLERIADELVDNALRERQAAAATAALRAVLAADRPAPRRRWFGW